jgi:thiol-disulfide isomerase/thioredoxin
VARGGYPRAPWCEPCRREIPLLINLQQKYGNRGLRIWGLAVDDETRVREFVAERGISYLVLVGAADVMRIQDNFGETGLPYSVLIGRDGRVAWQSAGELEEAEVEDLLQKLL